MTEQEIERCLERFTMGKTTDVMNFDYAGTLAYIQRLKAENAELRATLSKMETVEKELRERLEKADRRAEVAEKALKDMCEEYEDNFECDLYKECNSDKPCYLCDYKVRLQKAAREIEEEKGE